MSDVACCKGECCGPGSYCCQHAGPHTHAEDATPHDDEAPPAHHPDCLPPEPCVCARLSPDAFTARELNAYQQGRIDERTKDAPPSATDYPSEEELQEVDRLDREGAIMGGGARVLLPRLARAFGALTGLVTRCHDIVFEHAPQVAAPLDVQLRSAFADIEKDAYARGRREAIEEAVKHLGERGARAVGVALAQTLEDAADWITENERARGGK